jgi:transposase
MEMEEIERVNVIKAVAAGKLKPGIAALRMGLGARQIHRLVVRFKELGVAGLVSRQRGRASNHQLAPELARSALDLIREHYADFGPTLACEKLRECHDLMLSTETVRQLMTKSGLWKTRQGLQAKLHQPRMRRACFGELVQIDGSLHRWFEERADACSLLVYIDDATGRLLQLHFAPTESTSAYFTATRQYIEQHGKPQSFYADKAAIFRSPSAADRASRTQFHRALSELDIELICANSPQAKGRVERMNRTLQDRFVKELRLCKISSIDEANAWAATYIEDYNKRFAKAPRSQFNAHCALLPTESLELILAWCEQRKLSSQLTLQHGHATHVLKDCREARTHIGQRITIHTLGSGEIELRAAGVSFDYTTLMRPGPFGPIEVDSKTIGHVVDQLGTIKKRNRTYRQPSSAENAAGAAAAKSAMAHKIKRLEISK